MSVTTSSDLAKWNLKVRVLRELDWECEWQSENESDLSKGVWFLTLTSDHNLNYWLWVRARLGEGRAKVGLKSQNMREWKWQLEWEREDTLSLPKPSIPMPHSHLHCHSRAFKLPPHWFSCSLKWDWVRFSHSLTLLLSFPYFLSLSHSFTHTVSLVYLWPEELII